MTFYTEIPLRSQQRSQWVDLTADVQTAVTRSGLINGICLISSLHTTAGITVNENADPDVCRDFLWKLGELVPQHREYHHAEGNADSHVKASLVGLSAQLPVRDGRLVLGVWQSIYFCEFDGPRDRTVSVSLLGE